MKFNFEGRLLRYTCQRRCVHDNDESVKSVKQKAKLPSVHALNDRSTLCAKI